MKKAVIYILDDYADWEGAYLTTQLNKNKEWMVEVASKKKGAVKSIGGFLTNIAVALNELEPTDIDLFILIGGDSWTGVTDDELVRFIDKRLMKGQPVAAICGAVDFLASNGLLTNYKHTGNAIQSLENFDNYRNPSDFEYKQVVRDRNLVTANGSAALEWTNETLKMINYGSNEEINKMTDFYDLGFYNYVKKYGNPF